ncbi:MAG TPA: choice-of-anchor D domain-containing protein [Acidobacteriaceae bacterium]|nr:choice-of-anchor D domain-containing protein [Acidobacteriaceae bacterium]
MPRLLLFALSLFVTVGAASAQDKLLITQVYGGGGGSSTTASYKSDFVEIFNAGTASVSLSAYSVQYGPATGTNATFFTGITALSAVTVNGGALAPGQYLLIQEGTAGTGGATLTGADLVGNINLAQSAGKVALVKGTSLLGSTTGGCIDPSIASLVGYGTIDSTCAAGGAAVPATAVNTAAIRKDSCTDTGNNAADFNVTTPAPRNSSTTLAPCGGDSGGLYASVSSATATPASVNSGDEVTLTVVVAPNTSTGISVNADLSAIGGSAQQAFALTATNTYSYLASVSASTATGSYSLPVTVTDNAAHTATGSIALGVTKPIAMTPISTLQSQRSTYVGQAVSTTGVVTGVGPAGFFVQMPSATPGSTGVPEGIYTFTGTGKVPAAAVVGAMVNVTGTLSLFPAPATSHTPALEITSPTVQQLSVGNPLPAPIALSTANLSPAGGLYQLTRYEAMRVSVAPLTTTSGTDGSLTEKTETVTSNGEFYAVFSETARPFREPGVDIRDFLATIDLNVGPYTTTGGVTYSSKPTLFDDNPERILVDSDLLGGKAIDLSVGATVTGAVGVLDFTFSSDSFEDPARLLLAADNTPTVTPGLTAQPLAPPSPGQFTVAAFNVERFFNPNPADDIYFNAGTGKTATSLAVDVTADAYARRLKKVSLAIRNVLNMPDIVSVEEVENQSVTQDIANQINNDAVAAGLPNPNYVGYGNDAGSGTYTDDVGGISVGFLVKSSTVDTVSVQQYDNTDVLPTGGTLNDRPPFVLHAGVKRSGGTDYPITVIANHLRSLSGISTSDSTRLKKELQAEELAALIQGFQSQGEHVIALGDMNAFEFSDAYTDTMATITNRNVLPAGVVAQPGVAGLVTPPATDLVTLLPPDQRWSYIEFGNAQVLDHVVATQDLVDAGAYIAYAHVNAGMPLIAYNDATIPDRSSDHEPALSYITLPAVKFTGSVTGNTNFGVLAVGDTGTGSVFVLTNTGEGALNISGISTTGDFAETNNCGTTLALNSTCMINVVFAPTALGTRTGTLTIASNATNLDPITLSGTGALPSTLTLSAGPRLFGKVEVGTSSDPQTFTLANPGAAPAYIGSIAVTRGYYSETNDCGTMLAGNSSCTITVVFAPVSNGSGVADLVVTTVGAGAMSLDSKLIGVAKK